MAAAVFGGSPRHHNRIVSGNNPTSNNVNFNTNALHQQSTSPGIGGVNQSNKIVFPITSYISASTPASSQQYHQSHQSQQSHQMVHHQSSSSSHHNMHRRHHNKRKSAVELLAESKPFYVKSETVLERHQQLNYRGSTSSCTMSPSRTPLPHQRSSLTANRRSTTSSNSDLLQNKLRNLLNTSDSSKESITLSDLSPKYDVAKYMSPKKFNQELTVNPDPNNDVSVFFPSAFLSPQSLPPHPVSDDDMYSYSIDNSLLLTDDYHTISPPAEYAEDNTTKLRESGSRYCGYQRSFSHSQAVASNEPDYATPHNINSHKSLPDLHSQICRHSPHSEVLSCCSRGNRSNKSSGSFNRDSGGSSGHYTHRSEPCCKQQQQQQQHQSQMENISTCATVGAGGADFRRDSGSSTQHSGNSYYAYGIPPVRYDCMECRAKIQNDANCLLHFTTLEVPEAFQDDYKNEKDQQQQQQQYYDESRQYYKTSKTKPPPIEATGSAIDTELSPPLGTFKRQRCFRMKARGRYSSPSDRNCRSEDDRRPILRSKSDIGDRYWQRSASAADKSTTNSSAVVVCSESKRSTKSDSGPSSTLERFFERLGLNDEAFYEYIMPNRSHYSGDTSSEHSSPIFFSDTSTVDSTKLPDSTEVNPQQQNYKPSEPPSIVERNARIIKWLCNCRKFHNFA